MIKPYMEILKSRTGIVLIIGGLLLLRPEHWLHLFAFVLLYTAFDVFGYRDVLGFNNADRRRGPEPYRIVQGTFKVVLLYAIWLTDGWLTVAASLLAWWSLACDVLYYWCVKVPLDDFTWFRASPVVFVYNVVLNKPAPKSAVAISALVGSTVGLVLVLAER